MSGSVPRASRALLALAASLAAASAVAGCGGRGGGGGTATAAKGAKGAPAGPVVYVAPDGHDGKTCAKAAPCKTLSAAIAATEPSATIEVAAGRYPAQEVKGLVFGRPVVVRPAPGAKVSMGKLSLHVKGLELRDLTLDGWYAYADAGNLTLRDVRAGWFFVDSASRISILGGSVGPADSIDPQIRAADTDGAAVPRDILIDGVTFHDFTNRIHPDAHIECLQFGAGDHVVVRNSRFLNCAEHSIFVGSWGGTATVKDFTFEDNHFGRVPKGFYSLRVGTGGTSDIVVRRNSALNVMQVDPGVPGVTFDHNLGPRKAWECIAGQRYRDNVWAGVACDPSDRTVPAAEVARRAADLRRAPGA